MTESARSQATTRPRRMWLAVIAAALGVFGFLLSQCDRGSPGAPSSVLPTAPPGASGSPWFALISEMYGDASQLASDRSAQGLLTGATFHTVLSAQERAFIADRRAPFVYFAIPPEANVQSCYPSSTDPDAAGVLNSLVGADGGRVWRLGTPEFDQSGGCWASGRPSFAGMSDVDAYSAWIRFYLDGKGLRPYLEAGSEARGYDWMSVCVFAFCPQYAFDLGSDAVLLERNTDETSGITPGVAMLRGAAAQNGGKTWGIDISTWRYWTNGPTTYKAGRLVTGWSPSTFKRHLYIAYMAGANVVHGEVADYTGGAAGGSALNPLGQVVQDFHDFAVRRHTDRGTPFVPMAILQAHESGFEPRFGEWMQGAAKWYESNPWSPGDRLLAALLRSAYPGYERWGSLPAGSPRVTAPDGSLDVASTVAAYREALAASDDPRPWEPMASSRWGESIDVLTDRAPADVLRRYRVVVLATGTPLDGALLARLEEYVRKGGALVLNTAHLGDVSSALAGVATTDRRGTGSDTTWKPDGETLHDNPYDYSVVVPTTATVLARAGNDPIVTRNAVGAGAVYLTTADLLSDRSGKQLLRVGEKLLDSLYAQVAVVAVAGPPLEYLVSTDGPRVIVTLVNTDLTGAPWSGTLTFRQPGAAFSVREWTGDTVVPSSVADGIVSVQATVPPWDVRVYVLDGP